MKIAPRFPLEFPATLILEQGRGKRRPKLEATSANLSMTGVGLEFGGICPFKLGDRVQLNLSLGETLDAPVIRQVEMVALVVWVGNSRCGLEIIEMPENSRAFYENMLSGYQTLFEFSPVVVTKAPMAA